MINESNEYNESVCFHCTLPIPKLVQLTVDIDGQARKMCCVGCQSVAHTILDAGLADYYKHRDVAAIRPDSVDDLIPKSIREELLFYDQAAISQQFVVTQSDDVSEVFLVMEGIVCAACVWLLERGIRKIKGVHFFQINYSTHRAHLSFNPAHVKLSEILLQVRTLGYKAIPFDEHDNQKSLKKQRQLLLKQFAMAAIFSMQVMMLAIALYFGDYQGMSEPTRIILRWSNLILSIPCVTYASWSFYRSAWKDIQNARLSMDVNISLAIILGTCASVWNTIFNVGDIYFESVTMFAFLLLGARLVEMNARHKSIGLSDSILRIKPRFANRLNAQGEYVVVGLSDLKIDDILLIKPGDIIPTDGILISDNALIDESLLTGESLPIRKKYSDLLIGGALNIDQSIQIRVSVLGAQTVFSQMIRLIDRAMSEKPKIAQLADIISNWFVSLLLLVCVLSYIAWQYIDPSRAFEVALAVLVVSCPCALALATPAALTAGSQLLVSLGLLATRSGALENLSKVTDIVFDKTGTLTNGIFDIVIQFDSNGVELSQKLSREYLQIAQLLESQSQHPIAQAFLNIQNNNNNNNNNSRFFDESNAYQMSVEDIAQELGCGVSGRISALNQSEIEMYQLGKLDWIDAHYVPTQSLKNAIAKLDVSTWVVLAKEGNVLAFFGLTDQLKGDAIDVLKQLRSAYRIHLLSGDTHESVERLNRQCEFDSIRAACLPADKRQYVMDLQASGSIVAMLGDGLNDAPVLAQADVSIAMNQGAQLAQTTADMILLSDHLSPLLNGLSAAKTTQRIIMQNLMWALFYNIIALPIAAMGLVVPWIAALGMSASSLIVIANTLRLKK